MRKFLFKMLLLAALFCAIAPAPAVFAKSGDAAKRPVFVIQINGGINPASAKFIQQSLEEAEKIAQAFVIQLDTPGGLLNSTRDIVKAMLNAKVPVIVFVSPSGAHAGSAGVFITLAGHVAAMAPGTNIGAAHPVTGSGKDVEDDGGKHMADKIENDTAAFIQTIAKARRRNAEWAVKAVRESVSVTEEEALKLKVIDLIAPDLPSLLDRIDGRYVMIDKAPRRLRTRGAEVVRREMNVTLRFIDAISDPTIAYMLMTVGMIGLYFELSHPGAIFPGAVGGISLVLAFVALQTLPFNYGGLLLIGLAVLFFIVELYAMSYGLLTLAGVVSFVIGSMLLFGEPGTGVYLPLTYVIGATSALGGFAVLVAVLVTKGQMKRVKTGVEGLQGEAGEALEEIKPGGKGRAMVHGEYWNVLNEGDAPLFKGDALVVTGIDGLLARVRKSEKRNN